MSQTTQNFLPALLALLLAACSAPGRSEPPAQPVHLPRVGYLSPGSSSQVLAGRDGFVQTMSDLGYVDGKTAEIEYRFLGDTPLSVEEVAAGLVQLDLDVVVGVGAPRVQALKQQTERIPIVMLEVPDPVGAGLV